ncbi:MAG: LysM peptidoglycan-binding domain-containing protein [Firmicutes bacterium]|nr:LysM peptidoglycan-binding domain-containing protein [Bacillota bacterium]MBQ3199342.1 LysM peptidoglycan-binding domain-containing protein [Bacillota bacterium]
MNYHIIQPGDSLWSIAQNHGCSLQELLAANPQITNPNNISVGTRIMLPEGCSPETVPQPPMRPNPMPRPNHQHGGQMGGQSGSWPAMPMQVEPNQGLTDMDEAEREELCAELRKLPRPLIYVVKKNDNIYQLAKCFDLSMKELLQVNPQIQNPDMIYPGDKIFVPRSRSSINMHNLNEGGIRFCPTCGSRLN